jgi:hypothetical protein
MAMLMMSGLAIFGFAAAPLLAVGVFGVTGVVGAVLLFDGLPLWRRFGSARRLSAGRRAVALLPADAAQMAPMGELVVRGRVARLDDELSSPLGHRPCVAWRIVGKSSAGMLDDAAMTRFAIVGDDGGPARVDGGEASISLEVGVAHRGRPTDLDDAARTFLGERLIDPDDPTLLAGEAILAEGDPVVVCATTVHEVPGATDAGFRVPARVRVLSGSAREPLVIERGNGDGKEG